MKKIDLKTIAFSTAVALLVCLGGNLPARAKTDAQTSSPVSKEPYKEKRELLDKKRQKIDQEAVDAMKGTRQALQAMKNNDAKKAAALLEDVSGKLDILLAKHPDLKLIPADVEADVYDLDSSPEQVKKMIDSADDLIDDGKIQDARYILSALVSEIRITIINIPLGIFPDAIKEAAALSDQGKTDEAKEALSEVLNMLVKTTEVIPLPVLRAEGLVTAASKLEHDDDLSKEESRKSILELLHSAKQQLQLAQTLGYGEKKDYELLYDAMDEIKDVIHSEKSAVTWDKIKQAIADFKNKVVHPHK